MVIRWHWIDQFEHFWILHLATTYILDLTGSFVFLYNMIMTFMISWWKEEGFKIVVHRMTYFWQMVKGWKTDGWKHLEVEFPQFRVGYEFLPGPWSLFGSYIEIWILVGWGIVHVRIDCRIASNRKCKGIFSWCRVVWRISSSCFPQYYHQILARNFQRESSYEKAMV